MAKETLGGCCYCVLATGFFIGMMVFAVKTACVTPFATTVEEASLARMSLAAPAGNYNNNGSTSPAPAPSSHSLSYDLALLVALRWYDRRAMGFSSPASPLEAELRFLGRPLGRPRRLAGAEWAATSVFSEMVYRLAWRVENATLLALGHRAAAAFAAESAAGVFDLELVVAGEFMSSVPFRSRWCRLRVTCPLRLSVSKSVAAAPAPFKRVECAS